MNADKTPKEFRPNYSISYKIANALMRIDICRHIIDNLKIPYVTLSNLQKAAKLVSTYYSTKIEGNRLTQEEINSVLKQKKSFPGRERDVSEVRGYYAALDYIEQCVSEKRTINEKIIQTLHALVMNNGKIKVKPTPYRDGQNVIRDGLTGKIVYLPPETKDIKFLMQSFVRWINKNKDLPQPIVASIAHYQFVTIHPYYDGNGRVARLLATLILHLEGYGLKGIYSLDEYYANNLEDYYDALNAGPSHNYYLGREEANITNWIEYFCTGMVQVFEDVKKQAEKATKQNSSTKLPLLLRKLTFRQRKVLDLFEEFETITSKQIGELFGLQARACSNLCNKWVDEGFLMIKDYSRKSRKYKLTPSYEKLTK
ncbi:Fic family protein [Candidatus Babeliales bacterium]|nr:Fic family protein [Candidatus Babeliales bacterium]